MAWTQSLGFSDLPTIYNVSLPVGPHMPNVRDDVLLVQTLLKLANVTRIDRENGRAETSRRLKVDGWFGNQTKRMIEVFEAHIREQHLLLIADGVLEPSSSDGYNNKGIIYKIIHLNRLAKEATLPEYNQIPTAAETDPLLRQSLLTGPTTPDFRIAPAVEQSAAHQEQREEKALCAELLQL